MGSDGRVDAEGPPYYMKPYQMQAVLRAQWEDAEPRLKVKRRRDHARYREPEYHPSPEHYEWQQTGLSNGWIYALDDIQVRDITRAMREPRKWQRDWQRRARRRRRR